MIEPVEERMLPAARNDEDEGALRTQKSQHILHAGDGKRLTQLMKEGRFFGIDSINLLAVGMPMLDGGYGFFNNRKTGSAFVAVHFLF